MEVRKRMAPRPEHVEITAIVQSDPRRVAMPLHPRATTRRLRAPGLLNETPNLEWSWGSPEQVGDLVMTADGIRLVSSRVRDVFDTHLGADDEIQWLPGIITRSDGTVMTHWVPHFPVHHDLLNRELSTFGPSGLPILYVLSEVKLARHAVTALPGNPLTTIIAAPVADALVDLGATGIEFMDLAIGP